jgi:hypothetical protein
VVCPWFPGVQARANDLGNKARRWANSRARNANQQRGSAKRGMARRIQMSGPFTPGDNLGVQNDHKPLIFMNNIRLAAILRLVTRDYSIHEGKGMIKLTIRLDRVWNKELIKTGLCVGLLSLATNAPASGADRTS